MLADYYAILGVEPTADVASIRVAYRRQASACHPDHGGSHERMVQVNEAWFVLSNPESRARYDEACRHPESSTAYETSEADIKTARQSAADYPRQWKDFENWQSVADDFTGASYGTTTGVYGTSWPTAQNSASANIFIWCGGVIGVAVCLFLFARPSLSWSFVKSLNGLFCLAIFLALVGTWIGYSLHFLIGTGIRFFRVTANAVPTADSPPSTFVIRCPSCQQQLRLPRRAEALSVTCQKCRHVFDLPPSGV